MAARSRSSAAGSVRCSGYLLLRANEVVAQDRLVDALWGESPPADAR